MFCCIMYAVPCIMYTVQGTTYIVQKRKIQNKLFLLKAYG